MFIFTTKFVIKTRTFDVFTLSRTLEYTWTFQFIHYYPFFSGLTISPNAIKRYLLNASRLITGKAREQVTVGKGNFSLSTRSFCSEAGYFVVYRKEFPLFAVLFFCPLPAYYYLLSPLFPALTAVCLFFFGGIVATAVVAAIADNVASVLVAVACFLLFVCCSWCCYVHSYAQEYNPLLFWAPLTTATAINAAAGCSPLFLAADSSFALFLLSSSVVFSRLRFVFCSLLRAQLVSLSLLVSIRYPWQCQEKSQNEGETWNEDGAKTRLSEHEGAAELGNENQPQANVSLYSCDLCSCCCYCCCATSGRNQP